MADPTANAKSGARTSYSQKAYELIRRQILEGELSVGTIRSIRQTAESLGLGLTPVRDALRRLEAEGFISISERQGWVVRGRSVQTVLDLFEIRLELERMAVRRLCRILREEDLATLQEKVAQHRAALAAPGHRNRWLVTDFQFHRELAARQGNEYLAKFINTVLDQLFPELYVLHATASSRMLAAADEHQAIVAALAERDADRAAALMEVHLLSCRKWVLEREAALTSHPGT
jgi:DNA-binding GntR family transcriptional regulator